MRVSGETTETGVAARDIVIACDTANEVVAVAIGRLDAPDCSIQLLATCEVAAHRASNTTLLPTIDELVREAGIDRDRIACVMCGCGPGSFTGVRICVATAKGMASALEVGLYGLSTLDAIAWGLWRAGMRGRAAVVADAMRKEVYPVCYDISDSGVARRNVDVVMKAADAVSFVRDACPDIIVGDGLNKYRDLFEDVCEVGDSGFWTPTGQGLLLAAQAKWGAGALDPFDVQAGNPAFVLPVYTRLSDAEENERLRLSSDTPRDLVSGVQEQGAHDGATAPAVSASTVRVASPTAASAAAEPIIYRPLDAAHAARVAQMETDLMGTDAWSESALRDELPRTDRVWWAAFAGRDALAPLVGYAGGLVVDGGLQILKVASLPAYRRRGIARELLARVSDGARDLGACSASLEVRASNTGAQRFYEALGFHSVGTRSRYYSDREDALIWEGPLVASAHDVAGMELQQIDVPQAAAAAADVPAAVSGITSAGSVITASAPLILAVESSCDETGAAVIDGEGRLLSDVLASQIDFHARFGGVVPEIASRKHIEAICGVAQEGLDAAARSLGVPTLRWRDLSAVAVTYAPGLVGALVVGVAFAKGAAWGADKPFIGVNHLEGHLYANKVATPDIQPPMVVSLVSGGHTMLVHVRAWGDYETLGSTVDDAAGEAFDKVAKALGLGYPGGPVISKLAVDGDPKAIAFPRAMLHSGDLRFSLSGLKTAVVTYIDGERRAGRPLNLPDIAASFQQAVIDVQVAKAMTALDQTGAREFCLGGGVAANPALRAAYEAACAERGVRLTMPPMSSCTDNAGMIALVALDRYRAERFFDLDADVRAHASLDDPY